MAYEALFDLLIPIHSSLKTCVLTWCHSLPCLCFQGSLHPKALITSLFGKWLAYISGFTTLLVDQSTLSYVCLLYASSTNILTCIIFFDKPLSLKRLGCSLKNCSLFIILFHSLAQSKASNEHSINIGGMHEEVWSWVPSLTVTWTNHLVQKTIFLYLKKLNLKYL